MVILVAGMKASTTYHLKALMEYDNGQSGQDDDHTFITGAIPAGLVAPLTVSTTSGLTPQPGVELVNQLPNVTPSIPIVTDLDGKVIWYYAFPDRQPGSLLYPIKLLPNGHFMFLAAPVSQAAVIGTVPAGTLNALREVDLAGTTIRELKMADLNTRLAAAGFNLSLLDFSHDFLVLPNGHVVVICNTVRTFINLPGYPGTKVVLGDVIVDLDQNFNPSWVWNEFDHLDVNRHPYQFADWTHSNALAYSADDGNILISVRHQNWIVKVNYRNGAGDGSILWKLGYQGDFTLTNGVDPTDWFYAQHDVNFVSSNTTGTFRISIMDNGDDRVFPSGLTCSAPGAPACYTTIPIMEVNESARTATFISHQELPLSQYNVFAGSTRVLANTDIEFNLSAIGTNAFVYEVTPTSSHQVVWQMKVSGDNTYRAFRIPSLYPGVQW